MSATIKANVSVMFGHIEPWDVSNSEANLGPRAAALTWGNALEIAASHAEWLLSDLESACEGMRCWARETGAWERAEIEAWSTEECLALFAQNMASELRMLGSDDRDLEECARVYAETDWDQECEYPIGSYELCDGAVHVDYYTGS